MITLKPNIFISSTVKDLPNEREAAKRAIEALNAIPIMSEYTMNAVDKPSVQACIDEVKKADFYILILGGRYGWEMENGISITELEYDTAYKEKKPIFVFNTLYEKESKQIKFAEKAGSQRFWKFIKNSHELEDEIKKSIEQYREEYNYQKTHNIENLFSNLLEIEFPQKLFRAELNINRNEIIKYSKETKHWLKKSASQFEVIVSAIHQMELQVPGDWTNHENHILSFHDLRDRDFGLSKLVDPGTVEEFSPEEFYSIDDDHLRVFKFLLKKCLTRKLHHMHIKWYKNEGLFVYMPLDETLKKRQSRWHSKNDATRTVFEAKMKKNDLTKIFYCKHLAFRVNFYLFDSKWYLGITPDWFISFDGYKSSFYGSDQIKYLKKNERNVQVFNHLKFIVYQLCEKPEDDLFTTHFNYRFLQFNALAFVEAYPVLDEKNWYDKEDDEEKKKLIDEEPSPTLF